ncbi:MAG: hypothetical protein RIB03_10140 [Henriciella sp.]
MIVKVVCGFIFGLLSISAFTAAAQGTMCFGPNCESEYGELDIERPDFYGDLYYDQAVMYSEYLNTFTTERDACFKQCNAVYEDEFELCQAQWPKRNSYLYPNDAELQKVGYLACIDAVKNRYSTCLNPTGYMNCPYP